MSKTIKTLAYTLLALIIIAIVAVVIFINQFNPNQFKQQISNVVQQQTGRTLNIKGDISLSLFPWLGVKVAQVQLSNPEGFATTTPFASVQEMDIHVKLLPLLERRVEVGNVDLIKPDINLIQSKQGNNWQIAQKTTATKSTATESTTSTATEPATSTTTDSKKSSPVTVSVSKVSIKDGQLQWQDQQSKQQWTLNKLQLSANHIALAKPFTVKTSFDYSGSQHQAGHLSVASTVSLNDKQIQLQDFQSTVTFNNKSWPSGKASVNLNFNADVNLHSQQLALNNFKLAAKPITITGTINASQINSAPNVMAKLSLAKFNPRQLTALGVKLPSFKNNKALSAAQASMTINATTNSVDIKNLKATLDSSRITGKVNISDFTNPQIDYLLNVNQLNLDDYQTGLTPVSSSHSLIQQANAAPASQQQLLPVKQLRRLNLNGKLTIAKLIANGININKVSATTKANNGIITINPLTANIYSGHVAENILINVQKTTPRYTVKQSVKALELGSLLQATVGQAPIAGKTNVTSSLQASGNNQLAILKTLTGNLNFAVDNGYINGVDLNYQIARVNNLLAGKSTAQLKNTKKTPFYKTSGTINIKNGIATNNNLKLSSKPINVTGSGSANLVTEQFRYKFLAKPKGADMSYPISLAGTFSNPRILPPDLNTVKQFLKTKQGKELTGKVNKFLKKNLGDQIKIENFLR